MKSRICLLFGLALILAACEPDAEPEERQWPSKADYREQFAAVDEKLRLSFSETLYVPLYSNIALSEGGSPTELAATLSIRNIDPDKPIYVTRVAYYNTAGELIETYLEGVYGLNPLASASIVINLSDKRGGSGANFIVEWGTVEWANTPVVESIMIGSSGTRGFSFLSEARRIDSAPK